MDKNDRKDIKLGSTVLFSISDIENKSPCYSLENFTLEDRPHKALAFKSIIIPAYNNADTVNYNVKYKLTSGDDILIVPSGENLSASVENRVNFLVTLQPGGRVEKIFVEFEEVPVGFNPIDKKPIILEFITSSNIKDYDPVLDSEIRGTADNIAYFSFTVK